MKTNTWKEYLCFSRKERAALLVLAVITILCYLLPQLTAPKDDPPTLATIVLQPSGDTFRLTSAITPDDSEAPATPAKLFAFNPNTLDKAGFLQLGLSDKQATTIIHYREKGGHFYKPDDIRKIYGLRENEASRLIPFITPENKPASAALNVSAALPQYVKHVSSIDINTATAEDFKRFPGIGEVLSTRIIAFRTKLGGFCNADQLARTYGIKDSVFAAMKPSLTINTATIPHLNINTATVFQLQERPHMPEGIGQLIVDYRLQNGPYQQLNDLKKVIGEAVFQRVKTYLTLE